MRESQHRRGAGWSLPLHAEVGETEGIQGESRMLASQWGSVRVCAAVFYARVYLNHEAVVAHLNTLTVKLLASTAELKQLAHMLNLLTGNANHFD